jgi:hypothetical protein
LHRGEVHLREGEANGFALPLAHLPKALYTPRNEVVKDLRMLDHLINFEPDVEEVPTGMLPLEKSDPADIVDAQVKTADWLKQLGIDDDEAVTDAQAHLAQTAFTNIVTAQPAAKQNLTQIKTPAAVQHLVAMLTAYDWQFVERAQELRGYAVAKILEDCEHPTASIRLKALGMLGKITEVGLFTDKIEVKKTELSDTELELRIKDKLNKMAQIVDVTDVTEVEEDESVNESE